MLYVSAAQYAVTVFVSTSGSTNLLFPLPFTNPLDLCASTATLLSDDVLAAAFRDRFRSCFCVSSLGATSVSCSTFCEKSSLSPLGLYAVLDDENGRAARHGDVRKGGTVAADARVQGAKLLVKQFSAFELRKVIISRLHGVVIASCFHLFQGTSEGKVEWTRRRNGARSLRSSHPVPRAWRNDIIGFTLQSAVQSSDTPNALSF